MRELLEQMFVEFVAFTIFGALLFLVAIVWSRLAGTGMRTEDSSRAEEEEDQC